MQTNPSAPRPLSIPNTKVELPKTPAVDLGVPAGAPTPLQVKDGFDAAPAQASTGVKTDALLTRKIEPDDAEYKRLKTNLANARDTASVTKAYKELGAYVFGVPESKIEVCTDWNQSKTGQINLMIPNKWNNAGSVSGWTVAEGTKDGAPFQPGKDIKPALIVNAEQLTKYSPARAQKVLLHEGIHLQHAKQTATLYADFKTNGKKGESFETFLKRQKLSDADVALFKSEAEGKTGNTEAIAHTEAFIKSFMKLPHGATSKERLNGEGAELLDLSTQTVDKAVQKQQIASMKKFYDSLGTDDKKAMLNTLRDLPSNWLTSSEPFKGLLK